MRIRLLFFSLIFFFHFYSYSQNPLNKGESQFDAGVGLSGEGIPVYIGYDYSIHRDITIGGEISGRTFREHYKLVYYRHNVIGIIGNANYHFNNLLEIDSEWDTYAGINLGFYYWDLPDLYPGDYSSGVGLGLQIGGRYYFSDNIGLNLEFSGGNIFSGGKFGVSIKF